MNDIPPQQSPEIIRMLMRNLRYLGGIKPDHYLFLDQKKYHDATSWYDFFLRQWSKSHRDRSINFISDVLVQVADVLGNEAHKEYQNMIYEGLCSARDGIINLRNTYDTWKTDPSIIIQLDGLIDEYGRILSNGKTTNHIPIPSSNINIVGSPGKSFDYLSGSPSSKIFGMSPK